MELRERIPVKIGQGEGADVELCGALGVGVRSGIYGLRAGGEDKF